MSSWHISDRSSYGGTIDNAVNGKPTCAHDELLNDVLRKQWGEGDAPVHPPAAQVGSADDLWTQHVPVHP